VSRVEMGFHWDFATMVATFVLGVVVLAFFMGC
jgi:hypothetical protein